MKPSSTNSGCVKFLALKVASCALVLVSACRSEPAPEARPDDASAPAESLASPPSPSGEPRRSDPPIPDPALPPGVNVFHRDVVALAASADGRFLAGGDLGGRALLWDTTRNVLVSSDQTPGRDRVRPVVFAPPPEDGRWLAGAFDAPSPTWRFYDARAQTTLASWGDDHGSAIDAAFDPAGRHLVTATADPDRVAVWALSDAPKIVFESASRAVAVALDDGTGAATNVAWSTGKDVLVIAIADKSERMKVSDANPTTRLVFDGATLIGAQGAAIVRWSLGAAARSEVRLTDATRPIRELRRLPRGLTAVTRARNGLVLWDGESGAAFAEVDFGCPCELHALAADGCLAACACSERAEIRWIRPSGPAFGGCRP